MNDIFNKLKKSTMKKKTFKIRLILFTCLLFLISCSKNNDNINGHIINEFIQQEFEIKTGDTLKVNLGNFGDEEGAWIYKNPQNAKVSKTYRQLNASSVIYEYVPINMFVGKDTVTLIFNRGSDGASPGRNDTTIISIIVN